MTALETPTLVKAAHWTALWDGPDAVFVDVDAPEVEVQVDHLDDFFQECLVGQEAEWTVCLLAVSPGGGKLWLLERDL